MKDLAIVVPAYRAGKTIGRTVDSVRACRGVERARVLIVDDGSDDDTAQQATRPRVEVLRRAHAGRPAALNAGVQAAAGAEVVLFTDADCLVPPSWIEDALAELGDFDGVGGNLLPGARTAVELAKVLRYVHEFEFSFDLQPTYANACLNGNNMAIRRAALLAVGGFDETFLHGADADLTRRLLAAGCRLRRTTKLQTTHLKVETLGEFLRTMHRRGSTVRFGMKSGEESPATLARALLLSPWKQFFIDVIRAPRLAALDTGNRRVPRVAPPLVNLLGAFVNAWGRIHYYRYFQRLARDAA